MARNFPGENEGKPGLILRTRRPENLESPLGVIDDWLVPKELFFLRNHHDYPVIHLDSWRLSIGGHVTYPLSLSYPQLVNMPQSSIINTLECAGNKRAYFTPLVPGGQWTIGGVGNARWTGIPLSYILSYARLRPGVREIVFAGIDSGPRADMPGNHYFARSLPIKDIGKLNPLLALYMNNEILPFKHGFPVRLIVPGWYGMASVKWLTSIHAITTEFTGPYQKLDYVYLPNKNDYRHSWPVTKMKVNSVITSLQDQAVIIPGTNVLKGIAWAGEAVVAKVEVSTDSGATWLESSIISGTPSCYSWVFWEYRWKVNRPGTYTIQVRAKDNLGNAQPIKTPWNAKGYGNNSIHTIQVHLTEQVK